ADDFIDPLKTVSSLNQALKLRAALNTGKWLSRNGVFLDTVSPLHPVLDALIGATTGLQHSQIHDITISSSAIKSRDAEIKRGRNEYIKYVHRALIAADNKDFAQAHIYAKQAKAILAIHDIPYDQRGKFASMAAAGYESLIQRLDQDQFLKNIPPQEAEHRLNIYSRIQQMQQERNHP
ncbi:MAG: hypothetical protein ACREHG_09170, partial [Candidatus Saccharimonadales bacterium]